MVEGMDGVVRSGLGSDPVALRKFGYANGGRGREMNHWNSRETVE